MYPVLIPSIILAAAGLYAGLRFHAKVVRPRRRRERIRGWIEQSQNFRAVRFIGMGREGIVFEVVRTLSGPGASQSSTDADSPTLVIKVLYAQNANARHIQAARHRRLLARLAELGFGGPTPLPRVFEEGELRPEVGEAPYVLMEKLEGRVLGEMVKDGSVESIPVQDRLSALDELLTFVAELDRAGMSFVHLDPDNVMIGAGGRPRLIDLDGLRMQISARKRIRFHRRISRTVLALLGSARDGNGAPGDAAEIARFVRRLDDYARVSYRAKKIPAGEFESVADIRDHFRLAFKLPEEPVVHESTQSG